MLSDRDLKKVLGSPKQFPERSHGLTLTISSRKVAAIMRRRVVTTGPEERAADVAALMVSMKPGADRS